MKCDAKRKPVLLLTLAALIVIYIAQLAFTGKNKIKVIAVKETPDSFVVRIGNGEDVKIFKDGDSWFVGDNKYPANSGMIENMCSAVQSIKLLGIASRDIEGNEERYGLDETSRIVVDAYKAGEKIQCLIVGKNTSTNSQSYIQLEGGNSVYLAGEALHTLFAVDVNDLRSKEVYSIESNEIKSLSVVHYVDGECKAYKFERDVPAEEGNLVSKSIWKAVPVDSGFVQKDSYEDIGLLVDEDSLDEDKVASWVRSMASLNVSEWIEDSFESNTCDMYCVRIGLGNKTVDLKINVADEDDATAVCSETPYSFKIPSYVMSRFEKIPEDFNKGQE